MYIRDLVTTGMLNAPCYRPHYPEYWCCCGCPHCHLSGVFPYRGPAGYTHNLLLCKEEEKEERWGKEEQRGRYGSTMGTLPLIGAKAGTSSAGSYPVDDQITVCQFLRIMQ